MHTSTPMLGTGFAKAACRRTVWIASFFLLTACPQWVFVWVAPMSTAQDLRFEFGGKLGENSERSIGIFRLSECSGTKMLDTSNGNGKVLWEIAADSGAIDLSELSYGATPPGFSTRTKPAHVSPGCYHVRTSGGATAAFVVGSDGQIKEITQKATNHM